MTGLQGPPGGVHGASKGLQTLQVQRSLSWTEGSQEEPHPPGPRPANLLQLGVRTSKGPPKRSPKFWVRRCGAFTVRFRVKSMYIVYLWGVPSRCTGRAPEGLYTSTLHRLLPLSYPVRVYRLTCIFSV